MLGLSRVSSPSEKLDKSFSVGYFEEKFMGTQVRTDSRSEIVQSELYPPVELLQESHAMYGSGSGLWYKYIKMFGKRMLHVLGLEPNKL